MEKLLLFEGNVDAKQYLTNLLQHYPYDIDASLVYSLLSKHTYQHTALIYFIMYYRDSIKIRMCTTQEIPSPSLTSLFQKMCTLSQFNATVQHHYNFDFQASFYLRKYNFAQPYAHLPLQKILFIERIQLHETLLLPSVSYVSYPIQKQSIFIYRNISIDPHHYIAISIQITDKHGLLVLSKECASLLIPLCSLYHVTPPSLHQDFMLLFGIKDTENQMEYYYDHTNELYIGCVKGDASMHHIVHLRNMVDTLYAAQCVLQHDLAIQASMIHIEHSRENADIVLISKHTHLTNWLVQELFKVCTKQDFSIRRLCNHQCTLHNLDNEVRMTQVELACLDTLDVQSYEDVFQFYDHLYIKEANHMLQLQPCISFTQSKIFHTVTHILFLQENEQGIHRIESIQECHTLLRDTQVYDVDLLDDFITLFFLKQLPLYHIGVPSTNKIGKRIMKQLLDIIFP